MDIDFMVWGSLILAFPVALNIYFYVKVYVYHGAPILDDDWFWRLLDRFDDFSMRLRSYEVFKYKELPMTVGRLVAPIAVLATDWAILWLWLLRRRFTEKEKSLSLQNRILHGQNMTLKVSIMLQSWTQDILTFSKNDASLWTNDEDLRLEYIDELQQLRREWTEYLSPLPDFARRAFEDGWGVRDRQWYFYARLWHTSVRWTRKDLRDRIEELANVKIPGPSNSLWAHQFQLGVHSIFLEMLVDATDQMAHIEEVL